MMEESLIVDETGEGRNVYEALIGRFSGLPSRKSLKKALSKGDIFVDGQVAKWNDRLERGQRVSYMPNIALSKGIVLDQPLDILYEDDAMAIINKPAGILVSGTHTRTIEKALPTYLDVLDGYQPRPVHRLDRATSGCLAVARTAKAAQEMGRSFQERQVDKAYLAVVIGKIAIEGRMDLPIDGKSASSSWKRLGLMPSKKVGDLSLVEVSITTGRRHQIRKHFSMIRHPILGDRDHGTPNGQFGQGLYLHAWKLSLPHPISHTVVNAIAPIPKKYGRIFMNLNTIQ
jgi:23S rRNA pseudouridine1911/1915/1917 synthase